MTIEVRSISQLPGIMISSKPDHVEKFATEEEAISAIEKNWDTYQNIVLDVREVTDRSARILFDRSELAKEIERRREGRSQGRLPYPRLPRGQFPAAGYDVSDDNPALEERFTLFFDFLGASDAAATWPRERVHQFVDLLVSIAQAQSSEEISGASQEDGSYRLSVTPEITTFSDNVVVSYRGVSREENTLPFESFWVEIVCKDAIRILSSVAEMGLRIGLLIRGGLSFGQLYHESGVVFGEAMVDAYALESKVAIHPRIVVSERVIKKLNHTRPDDIGALLQDADGIWHLNYFAEMMRRAVPSGPDPLDQAMRRWTRAHLERINREIDELRRRAVPCASRRAAKWEWFKERFETATSRFRADFP